MTKGEIETIRNIINRLKEPNVGCARGVASLGETDHCDDTGSGTKNSRGRAHPSRIYIDSWLIAPLELLISEKRDVELARELSAR